MISLKKYINLESYLSHSKLNVLRTAETIIVKDLRVDKIPIYFIS